MENFLHLRCNCRWSIDLYYEKTPIRPICLLFTFSAVPLDGSCYGADCG